LDDIFFVDAGDCDSYYRNVDCLFVRPSHLCTPLQPLAKTRCHSAWTHLYYLKTVMVLNRTSVPYGERGILWESVQSV